MVYPAAEHTRFTHSIGVYGMSKRIVNALQKNSKRFRLKKQEIMLIAVAGLLHDIGHGPFSHALETAVKSLGGKFEHEDMSVRIITEWKEISSKLEKLGEGFAEKVCQVISKKYSNPYVASIISSQLDADRIDFLLRDSYMTGAHYGKFDVDWLLNTMSIKDATFPHAKGRKVVCVDYKKGLNVLEQYLLGRYYMYTHVYYHKVIRGFEVVMAKAIQRVLEQEHKDLIGYSSLKDLYSGTISLDDYLRLDDFTVISWFNDWYWQTKDNLLKKLLYHFLCRKPFYKALDPPADRVEYSKQKEAILDQFKTEEERNYYFGEDSPKNVAYKNLYVGDILNEIYISKEDEVIPLSAVQDSVINTAGAILKKDELRWYVRREGEDEDDGLE